MQSACGLATSKQIDGCRECRVEGGRQGKTGPDDEGKHDEDDHEIRGALNDIVGAAFCWIGRRAAQIFREDFAEGLPLAICGGGKKVSAEMVVEQARDYVDEAGDYQNPCRFEVEIAAPAILVGPLVVVAGGDGVPRCGDGDLEEGSGAGVAGFTPVEARVGDDDLAAGDKQREEGDDRDPMRYADERSVPLGGLDLRRGSD